MTKRVDNWVIVVIVVLAALLVANLFVSGTIFASLSSIPDSEDIYSMPPDSQELPQQTDPIGPWAGWSGPPTLLECGNNQNPFGPDEYSVENVHSAPIYGDETTRCSLAVMNAKTRCKQTLRNAIKRDIKFTFVCPVNGCGVGIEGCKEEANIENENIVIDSVVWLDHPSPSTGGGLFARSSDIGVQGGHGWCEAVASCTGTFSGKYGCGTCPPE